MIFFRPFLLFGFRWYIFMVSWYIAKCSFPSCINVSFFSFDSFSFDSPSALFFFSASVSLVSVST